MQNAQNVAFQDKQIFMAHGAGGEASRRLVEGLFRPLFSNPSLDALSDAATLPPLSGRLAVTVDSFVVQPLQFPGGSIGELAINGTVNDLAVSGARPVAIAAAFILEAGLSADVLRREVEAMARAARQAGVSIVTGDTKVVEHGRADGMYISTTGIGVIDPRADLHIARVRPGDRVLVSGPIGNHGMAIMLARAELEIRADIRSDTRSLLGLTEALLASAGTGIKWMRDATRGGVATVLNELAREAGVAVTIDEAAVPLDDEVRGACELLGVDPLHVANEGQFVAVLAAEAADAALQAMRRVPGGERACILGEIGANPSARVLAKSSFGGVRVVDMLIGDPLPRIC
ncbi:MAG TPA: hydrogenase expression/formation protein HypE [Pirellulales bacterium]|jgi:hydrogenase expression/formation protein HypE|nr:hydrogenase expression/formation protein HypE [Pirellulales bacterium]